MTHPKHIWYLLVGMLLLSACSSIDCPLNNRVYSVYAFKKADGTADTLTDTITVRALRQTDDTLVFNKGVGLSTLSIPMSYGNDEDALLFVFSDANGNSATDTVWIQKENHPHLESVDCTPRFFHTITGLRYTTYCIESITINNNEVDYDTSKEHFYVTLADD